jgi:hypothetical protein
VGFGDEILASGMARGAKARGKRIAFGNGKQIVFSPWSEQMFRYNPNIAHPGDEGANDIEWISHHKGNRLYNSISPDRTRWIWNMDFRPTPGEIFFNNDELRFAESVGSEFVIIEPNVPRHKSVASNKDWGANKYRAVADELVTAGHRVIQFSYPTAKGTCATAFQLMAPTFRHALAVLGRAALYIGPEGGLHHGAAAEKRMRDGTLYASATPAVVLFGGFIPSSVTGYDMHANLTGGTAACGKLRACRHCRDAMNAISVEKVLRTANRFLDAKALVDA